MDTILHILGEVQQWTIYATAAADVSHTNGPYRELFQWLFLLDRRNDSLEEGEESIVTKRNIVQRRFMHIHLEAEKSPYGAVLISCIDLFRICDESNPEGALAHAIVEQNYIVLVGIWLGLAVGTDKVVLNSAVFISGCLSSMIDFLA